MEYRHAMPQLRNRERRRCKVLRQLRNAPKRRGAGARGACRTRSSRSSCCSCRAGSAGRTRGDCRAGPTCSSGPAGHPATGRNPAAIRRRPAAPQSYAAAPHQPYAAPQPPYGAPMPEQTYVVEGSNQTLRLIAFIMNIVALVVIGIGGIATLGIGLVPLAWGIPMTVRSWGVYKGKKPNTVALGVCTLLFLNMISGILLLVAQKDE